MTYWGTTITAAVQPPTVLDSGGNVVQVATTNADWFASRSTGEVDEWDTQTSMPTKVHFPDGVKFAKLADSGSFETMLAIDTTGQVWGWGRNSEGQLCLGNTNPYADPVELPVQQRHGRRRSWRPCALSVGWHAVRVRGQ